MTYKVGQVVYIVLSKKGQVYPMMIVEEITKKTLKGEEVNYVLQSGSDSSTKILMSQIEGEIFETPDETKKVLVARATSQIEKIVLSAEKKSQEWAAVVQQEIQKEYEIHELPSKIDEEVDTVTLADGTVARLKFPKFQ